MRQITVGPGGPGSGGDFGNFKRVSVSGVNFLDADRDGVRDPSEAGLAGFRFYVDYDDDGVRDAAEPAAVSASNGGWTITGVRPGTYKVRKVVPANHVCTTPKPCFYTLALVSGVGRTGFLFGTAVPFRGVAILTRRVRLDRRSRAAIRLRCTASQATGPCTGTLTLRSSRVRPRRIGRRRFSIAAGRTARVRVKVSRAARRRIARRGRLRATARAIATHSSGSRATTTRRVILRRRR